MRKGKSGASSSNHETGKSDSNRNDVGGPLARGTPSGNAFNDTKTDISGKDTGASIEAVPLEKRMIESDVKTGAINKLPALHRRNAHTFGYLQFYLPGLQDLEADDGVALVEWSEAMDVYRKDLLWLAELPYHKFWSFLLHSSEIAEPFLSSFLLRSIKAYDPSYEKYAQNPVAATTLAEIYALVFRIFLRISVHRESKVDLITPSVWGSWLIDRNILNVPKILEICSLYDVVDERNETLSRMIGNLFKNEPRFNVQLKDVVNTFLIKIEEPIRDFGDNIRRMVVKREPDVVFLRDLITFQVDTLYSLTSLIKNYETTALTLQECDQLEVRLAAVYEEVVPLFGSVCNLPGLDFSMSSLLSLYRECALELYRRVITAALEASQSLNSRDVDRFFDVLMLCIEDKLFIYDYTQVYSFLDDVAQFNSRGANIDDTRLEYILDAISECWANFGDTSLDSRNRISGQANQSGSISRKVDPLLDPDFDRQLLGACSLEVNGVELQSLITQIKDLFSDLPDRYIEVLLKHYAYKTEDVINAILENNLPPQLDKYKNEPTPSPEHCFADSAAKESFHRGKWKTDKTNEVDNRQLKEKIYQSLSAMQAAAAEAEAQGYRPGEVHDTSDYVDASLLPSYYGQNDYDDEYDDTYDESAMGQAEPGDFAVKPLNQKMSRLEVTNENSEPSDDESSKQRAKFEQFVEDPAVVRERMERKRAEKSQLKRHHVPEGPRDLVGKPKGQGQEKEVLLNRRYKTMHSNQQRRRGADHKRKV